MARYYVNDTPQYNGDHEVHKEGCHWLSFVFSKKDLGYHSSCVFAVLEAKRYYAKADGCKYCNKECHES